MKILFKISRVFIIFFIWTVGFSFWLQRLMLSQWGFNPISKLHWIYIWEEWQAGWIIQSLREWMFVFTLCAMIPVWFSGFIALCAVPWFRWTKFVLLLPLRLLQKKLGKKKQSKSSAKPKVTKKKSYKQTRPPAVRAATGRVKKSEEKSSHDVNEPKSASVSAAPEPAHASSSHSSSSSSSSSASSGSGGGTIMDTLRSFGYRLISDAKIGGKKIDFVGVADNHLLLCLVDSEPGDWLADEERFNDEEPLWFSESNHRVSPVRIALNARDALASKLSGAVQGFEVKTAVIIRQGTIINAEDMFEVWKDLKVAVCRYDEGGPEEIKELPSALSRVSAPNEEQFRSASNILN